MPKQERTAKPFCNGFAVLLGAKGRKGADRQGPLPENFSEAPAASDSGCRARGKGHRPAEATLGYSPYSQPTLSA